MERVGVEIEKKYIIEMPTVADMSALAEYTSSEIVQIYLTSAENQTRRVRSRKYTDRCEYYETVKIRIDKMSSTEIERDIAKEEFDRLSCDIAAGTRPIIKTRYTFLYLGQTFEIDVYPEWKRSCIMETELDDRERLAKMPPFIKILIDVTGDKSYSNASMSRAFPAEII